MYARVCRIVVVILVVLVPSSAEPAVTVETFDRDPGWDGINNVPTDNVGKEKAQDFGHRLTNHARGESGEIGGRIYRSLTPCYYAKAIAPKSLNDRLSVSGKFAVTHSEGGSGMLFGWFNSTSRGWRTPNSLAVRLDGGSGTYRIFYEYGTQHWLTGDGTTFEGRYQTTATPPQKADGTPHAFSFDYDPGGADGHGEMVFILDGVEFRAALAEGHKEDGANFDRFGIFNQQSSGDSMEVWFDDLVVNGERISFADDPQWEGVKNETTFTDRAVRPYHDFGYRESNHAGGEPGEIGGIVWRIEQDQPEGSLVYGTPVNALSMDDPLRASGRVAMTLGSADSGVLIGWYNSATPIGSPPANFIGVFIEGPSRVGHYFRPAFANSANARGSLNDGPVLRADSTSREWTLTYDPAANGGQGRIVAALDGQEAVLDLPPDARPGNANFDRFGVLSWNHGGLCVDIYFDDLHFTSGRAE